MASLLLRIVDRFAWAVRLTGADYAQFRAILATKLTLDNRRQTVLRFNQQETGQANGLFASLAFFAFMGAFSSLILLVGPPWLLAFTVIFSFVMFMLAMSLIADFSAVLLDTVDLMVLGPRPVSGRTILVARLVHISTYLGLLALSLSAGTVVIGTLRLHLLFPIVFLPVLAALIALVVVFVSAFYLVALRYTDGERFRDIVLLFQIAMSIFAIGGYQFLPHLVDFRTLWRIDLATQPWIVLYPPLWFAAPFELLFGQFSSRVLTLTGVALIVPVVGLWFVVRVLSPNFGRLLAKLQTQSPGAEGSLIPTRRGRGGLMSVLRHATVRSPEERLGFDLSWLLTGRDRPFKLRTYPGIAVCIIFPCLWIFQSGGSAAGAMRELRESALFLLGLYATAAMLSTIVFQVGFSPEFEAGWIYRALPVGIPGRVLRGSIEAVLLRFGLPLFVLMAGALFAVIGWSVLPHAILAACLTWTITVMFSLVSVPRLPFSESATMVRSAGQFGRNLLAVILPGAAGLVHYVLTKIPYAVPLAIVPAFLIGLWTTSRYDALDWPTLEKSEV